MKAKNIVFLLIPINILLAYFIYNSITSEIEFNKAAKIRIAENVQKLKDLRQIQVKQTNKWYLLIILMIYYFF